MKFNSEDIWHDIPVVKLFEGVPLPPGVFRFSLSDFISVWKGFPSKSLLEKRDRLERIFNAEQNVLNRIDQQLDSRTCVSEPPILLTAFWTNLVVQCELDIHHELRNKRLTGKMGGAAKGGVEWFKDTPTSAIPIILKWVTRYRNRPSVIASETATGVEASD